MLTEVGLPTTAQSIRQHRERTAAGEQRRSLLFTQYFQKLLNNPSSSPTVSSLSPPILGCGEQHTLAPGNDRPSRRAEFIFFLANQSPTVACDQYLLWRNPCAPLSLPPPQQVNAFFVSVSGSDTAGTGSASQPWQTFQHSLAEISRLRQSNQHVILNVLAGVYNENVVLPTETTLLGIGNAEVRSVPNTTAPTIEVDNVRNSRIRDLKITQGQRSGIEIKNSDDVEVNGCEITDNFAPRGGGIKVVNSTNIKLESNQIQRNQAGTISTAIINIDIDVSVVFDPGIDVFDIQLGDAHGGGIYLENSQQILIRNNQILENRAILFGGGIAIDNRPGFDSAIEVRDNIITCNQVSHGNLQPLQAPPITCSVQDMNDPVVERAEAETIDEAAAKAITLLHGVGLESGLGGGIALRHVSPQTRILGNTIGAESRPNRARRGGGIECFTGAYPHIEENAIAFNLVSDDGGGIAIDQFDPFLSRSQPTFLSFRRGSIFPRQPIRLVNNRIRFNRSIEDGGGLYGTGNAQIEIRGNATVIEGNRAGENGGGLRISYATRMIVVGAKILNNQSNTIGTEREGGGGIAARNAEIQLQDCELNGNIANHFAGGAAFCTSTFEGGFNREGFVANRQGQFDEIMLVDYGFTTRRYLFDQCRGRSNEARGNSGAGGFLYALRDSTVQDGIPRGGIFPIQVIVRGDRTAIGENTSSYNNAANPGGALQKRGNVVIELSGRLSANRPEDRAIFFPDVPASPTGIAPSTPSPSNHPVVIIHHDGRPDDHPTTFPYQNLSPRIDDVQPRFGLVAGGTSVTIRGQDFLPGVQVLFGTAPATINTATDALITVTIPPNASGFVDVTVRNPDSQTDIVRDGFTYVLPLTIIDVQPRSGSSLGGTLITITGTGFLTGATVLIDGRSATVVSVSATQITAETPSIPGRSGVVDVEVQNPTGQSERVSGGFTYFVSSPRIFGIQPRSGASTIGVPVTVSGNDFLPGAELLFGGQLATNIVVSTTQISATTPIQPNLSGLVDLQVTNLDGQSDRVSGGYEYIPPPRISDVQPRSGASTGGDLITITGSGFQSGITVSLGSFAATSVTVISATELTAITPASSTGAVDVVILNPDRQVDRVSGGFTYQ
nr:IPT/TIG domain-containing protein [Myxacorys almedinensis]